MGAALKFNIQNKTDKTIKIHQGENTNCIDYKDRLIGRTIGPYAFFDNKVNKANSGECFFGNSRIRLLFVDSSSSNELGSVYVDGGTINQWADPQTFGDVKASINRSGTTSVDVEIG